MPKPKADRPKLSNKPFTPRGAELGPLPMPTEEEILAELMAEAETSGNLWDELMPEYAGLLDYVYMIAAGDFDEAVAASKEFFSNRMQNKHLIVTGVKELHDFILTFAVVEK